MVIQGFFGGSLFVEMLYNAGTTLRLSYNVHITNHDKASKSHLAFWGSRKIQTVNLKRVHMNACIKRRKRDYFITIIEKVKLEIWASA